MDTLTPDMPDSIPVIVAAPRRRWYQRRWVRLTILAAVVLIAASAATTAVLAARHHPAPHRPAAVAPAVPTPDQVLTRDGYTPMGSMTRQELLDQAPTPAIRQILQPLVDGTSSIGTRGNASEIVIPVTPAGRTVLNNPAMLGNIAYSSGDGSTAQFAGPYLVITSPTGNSGG